MFPHLLLTLTTQPQGTFEGATLSSAGIKNVYIKLKDETADPDKWWTGTSWSTWTINWLPVTGQDSWSYSFNDSNWISNHKYILNTKAYDNTDVPGSNEEVSISTRTFYIDLSSPTNVQVASPSGNVKTRPQNISGTAKDNTGTWESGISEVKVTIYDVNISSYFNTQTNSWQSEIYWATTTLTGVPVDRWNLSITDSAWTDGHQYQLKCRAWDVAGNWTESAYTYFVFDETPPESFIAVPVDGIYYPAGEPTALNGTATDNKSGVTEVVVRIMKKSGANAGEHWSVTDHTWHPVIEGIIWSTTTLTGSNPWNWEIPSSNLPAWEDGISYLIVAKSKDAADNEESVFTVGVDSNTFTYDTSQPEVAVTTPSTHVNYDPVIYGTSMDYTPGIVSEVRVKIRREDDVYWTGSDWGDIGVEYWVLADGTVNWSYSGVKDNSAWGNELEYSVWAKARDDAGNWSQISSTQTFIVDKSSPSSGVTVPVADGYYRTFSPNKLTGTANDKDGMGDLSVSDINSGEIKLKIKNEDTGEYWRGTVEGWGAEKWVPVTGYTEGNPWSWEYDGLLTNMWTSGNKYSVKVQVMDNAGNLKESGIAYFYFDNTNSTSAVTYPVDTKSYSAIDKIEGVATDEASGIHPAGVDYVEVRISSGTQYWQQFVTSGTWVGNEVWNVATKHMTKLQSHQQMWR